MFRYIFLLLILFSACNNQNEKQNEKQNEIQNENQKTQSSTAEIDTDTGQAASDYYEGIYITNINTKTFRDCRYPDSVYWVRDDSKKLEGQYSKMFTEKSVYNAVYIKVKGDYEKTGNIARSEKYPRTFRVTEVLAMEKKNPENTCVPYDFWVLGNGKSFSLEISKFENLIELIVPAENKTYYFFYNEPTEDGGLIIYKSHNFIQRYNIVIKIKKENCSDAKDGKLYEYSANIELSGDKKFYGCAIKGKVE